MTEPTKELSQEEIQQAHKEYIFLFTQLTAQFQTCLKILFAYHHRIDRFTTETSLIDGKSVDSTAHFFKGDMEVMPEEFVNAVDPQEEIKALKEQIKMLIELEKMKI